METAKESVFRYTECARAQVAGHNRGLSNTVILRFVDLDREVTRVHLNILIACDSGEIHIARGKEHQKISASGNLDSEPNVVIRTSVSAKGASRKADLHGFGRMISGCAGHSQAGSCNANQFDVAGAQVHGNTLPGGQRHFEGISAGAFHRLGSGECREHEEAGKEALHVTNTGETNGEFAA